MKWINHTLADINKMFLPYKRVDESLESYLPSLKLLVVNENKPVVESLMEDLNAIERSTFGKDDKCLEFFIKCVNEWVTVYCREHVNVLDGKVRFQLQSFFDETILVNSGYNLNFNMREKVDKINNELEAIITLSWRLFASDDIDSVLKSVLKPIIEAINVIHDNHRGVVSRAAVVDLIQGLCIQRFFYSIFTEENTNAYSLLLGHRIVLTRLFKLKKSTEEEFAEKVMVMRPCGEFGSILGLEIHCYRLACASLLACTEKVCWEPILTQIRNSPLCHSLSPLINKMKHMHNYKLEVRVKELKDNGDIEIDDFRFPKSKWCRLIPKLNEQLVGCMEEIFSCNLWRSIVCVQNDIHVTRISDESTEEKEDQLHYNFFINSNGRLVNEKDLSFRDDIPPETFGRITALVMIVLHGLGLGSARIAELLRIKMHQIYWRKDCLYYLTVSNKRRSCSELHRKPIRHKLPQSTSRYLLLYDYIGRNYCSGREIFLFDTNYQPMDNEYVNGLVHTEFASIFELEMNCDCLVMRHLYTSICNYLFPGSANNFDESVVSSVEEVAEMSGHSSQTHRRHYSSIINREYFFRKYHQSLGAEFLVDDNNDTPLGLASVEDCLYCLRVLLGVSATFLSETQKDMILDSCNNFTRHSVCLIGCGGGKSMSWIIPSFRYELNGQKAKMSIVVVPYCFLLDHHVSTTKKLLGQCSGLSVDSLKGCEIDNNVRPNILREREMLPTILFVSLEAISSLVTYHFGYLEELVAGDHIFKIYIDECHTSLSELNFRQNYRHLRQLSGLRLPMVLFSGSFQTSFVKQFLYYMFGEEDESHYNCFSDNELIGKPLVRLRHVPSDSYWKDCCNYVRQRLDKLPRYHIHIIVSTKDEGENYIEFT